MTEKQPFGTLELSIEGTDQRWSAEIEAQGTDHLRVRILEGPPPGLQARNTPVPGFPTGSQVICTMDDSSGRCSAGARVLSQSGLTLWLNVEANWRKGSRRAHSRAEAGFGVSYEVEGVTGVGLCLNISPGGIRIRVGEPLPLDTPVRLVFRLPQKKKPLIVGARVLYQRPLLEPISPAKDDAASEPVFEAGLKFVNTPMTNQIEIAKVVSACINEL